MEAADSSQSWHACGAVLKRFVALRCRPAISVACGRNQGGKSTQNANQPQKTSPDQPHTSTTDPFIPYAILHYNYSTHSNLTVRIGGLNGQQASSCDLDPIASLTLQPAAICCPLSQPI